MSDIIQLLPDHVANQIAAGEVVQRPASVVKELLENAIDAKSTFIKLIVKEAGKTLIQVIDNGIGMTVTDARLSFERHATSKIKNADDLFQLNTKGFRGEALASIAAIAHVEMKTKQEQEDLGTAIVIEGSEISSQEVVVTPKGTSIAVKNLFFNIPARRNFLKSNAVELRHIIDEFHRVVLAHPTIGFALYHNGSELFNLPESNYRQRIVNVLGHKTNEKLVPVEEQTEIVKISGFVCKPEFSKKTRGEQYFFVNNRFIKSAYLNHSISAAFQGLLKDGFHASYFLYLEVNPQSIDINIHPTKTEIKFDDEQTLYAILRAAVKHSLGQFNIAPVLDFDRDASMDTSYNSSVTKLPNVELNRSFNPFSNEVATSVSNTSTKSTSALKGPKSFNKAANQNWDSLYVGLESKSTKKSNDFTDFSALEFESQPEKTTIFNDAVKDEISYSTYQLNNKYIISAIKSGLLLIDQHRAHQRVLYEDFLKHITVKEAVSQQLLFPLELHLSKQDAEIIKQLQQDLEYTGFVFGSIAHETIQITGVPVSVPESEVSILLEQLISDVENEVPDANFSVTDLISKSLSKSLAIKNGQKLAPTEQEHLVNSLFACKEPSVSPTNRATFITMSIDELDKKFV
jgi:DNA mismatch repair protein MutL